MAIGAIANSKGALVFAGGVLASAALVAMSMGSQFTPKPQNEEYAEEEVESSEEAPERTRPRARDTEPVVFGDFGDDTDLIDDTSGFDPAPPTDSSIIISEDSGDEEAYANEPVVSAAPARTTATSISQQRQIELNKYTPNEPTAAGYNSRPALERGEEEG